MTFRSPMLRRLVVAWLALLAFFALAAVITARPAEASPRQTASVDVSAERTASTSTELDSAWTRDSSTYEAQARNPASWQ